jgi:hypothetical protein
MSTTRHSAPRRRLTFLDLPPETRVMIYKLTCSTFTVHVRPRFLTPDRELLEQPTIVTLTDCNILSLSKKIRNEALPYVQISPAIQICRSAIVEIHQAIARQPDGTGHSETTCRFLSHISPTPCGLHRTPNFSLLTSDRTAIAKYFILGFDAIRTDCKSIMTEWVKVIEKHDKGLVPQRNGFRFVPPWWPDNLTWMPRYLLDDDGESVRDPCPTSKGTETVADRIHVLAHILLHAGNDILAAAPKRSHSCSVTDLELSTWRQIQEMQNPNTPEVLEEMFKVRQLMGQMGTGHNAETILSGLGI